MGGGGMRWKAKEEKLVNSWYAWHPVYVEPNKIWVWRERIFRAWISAYDQGFWVYGLTPEDIKKAYKISNKGNKQ